MIIKSIENCTETGIVSIPRYRLLYRIDSKGKGTHPYRPLPRINTYGGYNLQFKHLADTFNKTYNKQGNSDGRATWKI